MPDPSAAEPTPPGRGGAVASVAIGLVALQIAFRGWASLNGWFFADDLLWLSRAHGASPFSDALLADWGGHLMPAGFLSTWLVALGSGFHWTAASLLLLGLQLLADLACWWMVATLFGRRWLSVGLLAFYLLSPLTFPSFMWWASSINQVPVQASFFALVACYARWVRTGRPRWAVAAAAALAFGLGFDVMPVLYLLPLLALALIWFRAAEGRGVLPGVLGALRRDLVVIGALGALVGAYAVVYLTHSEGLASAASVPFGTVADAMFRRSLGPVLLGGPWRWSSANPPVADVATPDVLATLAWVVLALLLAWVLRARPAGAWAFAVVLPYLLVVYLLTATTRGFFGAFAGLQLRYLADGAPVLTLGIGLLLAPVIGSSRADPEPPRITGR
ncbi:MAG: hypothetical protein QM572_05490, partial [Nocardioides sp.]|uniref:hypothetical protein n=1 Tax=Nocardioides sp. TaxID=35761 RepID=UPI0039E60A4D